MTEKDWLNPGPGANKEVDVKAVIRKYLSYWYLFAFMIALFVGAAYLLSLHSVPYYTINSKILIKDDKSENSVAGGNLLSDLDMLSTAKNINNEIEILKSKSLMNRVIRELPWEVSYYLEAPFGNREVYGADSPIRLSLNSLDSSAYNRTISIKIIDNMSYELEDEGQKALFQFGMLVNKPYASFSIMLRPQQLSSTNKTPLIVSFNDPQLLATHYNQKLVVSQPNKMASILSLSITDPVGEKGRDLLTKLIEVYNTEAVEDKNQLATNTINFIDERMKFLTKELSDVEKDVEQYKRRNEVTDVTSQASLYMNQATEYNRQLNELSIQIDVLESIEHYLSDQSNQYSLVPSSLIIEDPTLLSLIKMFNEMQMERDRLMRVTKRENPLVQNLDKQLYSQRLNILENLRNIRSSLVIARKNFEARTNQFGSKMQKVPGIERGLQEIGRQQGVKEALYLYLLQKREESALSLASTISSFRTIDPVIIGAATMKPPKSIVYLLAVMLGICLPMGGIFIKDFFNDKVRNTKDIKAYTSTPILGEVPRSSEKRALVITAKKRTIIAELFSLIRANLKFSTVGNINKVVMVTSSMSGEGKTFFSINLAASLALTGKRVVVLSFDLRKPKLMHDLGLPNTLGITNYLINEKLCIEDVLIPSDEVSGLFLMASGPLPPNPAEIMMSARVNSLFDALKASFDYIIVDTAPVGQVADAFTLTHLVDSCIYLVRKGYTFKAQLEIIDDIYRNRKIHYPMIVFNDADLKNAHGYGYGYGYGDTSSNGKSREKKSLTI